MKPSYSYLLGALCACLIPAAGHAQSARAALEAQKTEAAVRAVDDHWGEAETRGDVAYLDRLWMPEYRSVQSNGNATSREQLLKGAAKRQNNPAAIAKAVADSTTYANAHSTGESVVISGNTAVLTFYDKKLGPQKGVEGADIFVYENGGWHALFSEHTTAK